MARAYGVSPATVQRIWSARGLKPHLVKTFKLSHDPAFEDKLIDVVGLYLNPPDQAVVLCVDEKSQIQALDRSQPGLPMKKGRAGTMTHDYKRNGTTTLFAALDVLIGVIIGQCLPRHRHHEFLAFLRRVDRAVPAGLAVHLILDNDGTHQAPQRADVARQARALPPALHTDLVFLAQSGRAVVSQLDRQDDPARRLPLRPRSHHHH